MDAPLLAVYKASLAAFEQLGLVKDVLALDRSSKLNASSNTSSNPNYPVIVEFSKSC